MRTETIGDIKIDCVTEIDRYPFEPNALLGNITAEIVERHKTALGPRLVEAGTNNLIISFHGFVIRSPRLTIVVDTCNGNHKPRPDKPWQNMRTSTNYLSNLARVGVRPEDVDIVLCTHLHGDHVGWNTELRDGRWTPTFPNARYLMSRRDYDYFAMKESALAQRTPSAFSDSVLPVIEAGRAEFVDFADSTHRSVDDNIWIEPAPGHTPGHVTVHVKRRDHRAVLSGDIIHHPIQFFEPHLSNNGDVDPLEAQATRHRLLQFSAESRAILMTAHFPAPTAGYVMSVGDQFRFGYKDD